MQGFGSSMKNNSKIFVLILAVISVVLGLHFIGIWDMSSFLNDDILYIIAGAVLFVDAFFLFINSFKRY